MKTEYKDDDRSNGCQLKKCLAQKEMDCKCYTSNKYDTVTKICFIKPKFESRTMYLGYEDANLLYNKEED